MKFSSLILAFVFAGNLALAADEKPEMGNGAPGDSSMTAPAAAPTEPAAADHAKANHEKHGKHGKKKKKKSE